MSSQDQLTTHGNTMLNQADDDDGDDVLVLVSVSVLVLVSNQLLDSSR